LVGRPDSPALPLRDLLKCRRISLTLRNTLKGTGGARMSGMSSTAHHAMIRFGLGRRGTEPLPADPAAWLIAQTRAPDTAEWPNATGAADGLRAFREDQRNPVMEGPNRTRQIYRAEAEALLSHAMTTDAPLRERMVWFWANHFTVSTRRGECTPMLGAFIRETIRPHVFGRFEVMLLAVERHPAMLLYLDAASSVGPDSQWGRRANRGLNENLAREILELHTLGVNGGYSQADVTEFAKIITGWTVEREREPIGTIFRPATHQPGQKTLLGRHFEEGEQAGIEALKFLAAQPATHRFLATKLVRHFVADEPPAAAVDRIAGVLRDTSGDLGEATRALIRLREAWTPQTKLRAPIEFIVAAHRAVDLEPQRRQDPFGATSFLGQPVWSAPGPNGWSDRAPDWAAPEAMLRRVDWSHWLASRAAGSRRAVELAEATLGPLLRDATKDAIGRAGSNRDALTLLLSSPEFQRR
jgi:uncharacterized protein (DUF1800 family)